MPGDQNCAAGMPYAVDGSPCYDDGGTSLATVDTSQQGDAGLLNTFMMDTVGVLVRATGTVDPWTKAQLAAQAGTGQAMAIGAGATADEQQAAYNAGAAQSALDTQNAVDHEATWNEAAKDWWDSMFNDNGSGCSLITNPAGCYPSWAPYAIGAILVLGVLWVLRPYIGLAEEAGA